MSTNKPSWFKRILCRLGFHTIEPATEKCLITALNVEAVRDRLTEMAAKIRAGDTLAFEHFWIEGRTEEGDAKIWGVRELLWLRYSTSQERIK